MEHRGNDDHKVKHYFQTNQTPIPIVPAPHGHPLPNPRLDHKLQQFWAKQTEEAQLTTDFKAHGLPLARIKKIVKSEDKVKMVGSDVPVILAKACEMFILELTLRSWDHTEEKKRRTLQRGDIAIAVEKTDVFDFLVDIVPRERYNIEEEVGISGGGGFGPCPCQGASYSYVPPPPFVVNAQPMWPRPPLPSPPVNVRQPPPPVPSFVEDPTVNAPHAAQSYLVRPMWPQTPPPPPYAGGSNSYQQG